MMPKFLLSLFLISTFASANALIDCRVVTDEFTECNPYTKRYLYAKEIHYDKGQKKLIRTKTIPSSDKPSLKVVSVKEVAERYTLPNESLRFRGSDSVLFEPTVIYDVAKIKKKEEQLEERKQALKSREELEKYISYLEKYEKELYERQEKEFGTYTVISGDALSRLTR